MSATEYFEYYKEYTEKYGEKTLVLIQNGAFYEMYAFKNDDEDLNYTNLKEISEIMDIVLTKKNKKKEVTLKSPYMAGIPIKAIDKYIRKISEHNYTIVLVDQITEPPRPERAVVEVISPGTSIRKETLKSHTNYLLSIYIESEENDMYAGVSAIDLSTGKSIVLETYSDEADVNLALDEIYRCIKCHNPREIIIYDTTDNKNFLLRYLEIEDKAIQYYNTIPIKYTKVSYQNKFLEKIFEDTGMISPIVYLQLEYNPFARISYIIALDFAHNHNERIVKHIEKPIIWESSNHLVLTLNSLEQLNIINNSKKKDNGSLLSIIDNTSTPVGKRLFQYRLSNPTNRIDKLNECYEFIDAMINNNIWTYKDIEENLRYINDIERLHRRMRLKCLNPCHFSTLDIAYRHVLILFKLIETSNTCLKNILPSTKTIELFKKYINDYNTYFDIEEIEKSNLNDIHSNFFNYGVIENIDVIATELTDCHIFFETLSHKLSHKIEKYSDYIKITKKDRDGTFLTMTKKRGSILEKKLKNIKGKKMIIELSNKSININYSDIKIEPYCKNNTKVDFIKLREFSFKLESLKSKLDYEIKKYYFECLDLFNKKYSNVLKEITKFIGIIDVIKSCSKTAILYNYCKPNIDKTISRSYVDAKSLRHPIIERIQDYLEYVPNDLTLGKEETGILLYGVNASGKSSLMKSLGINIIMAQAGMYVSASSFDFYPYNSIFTRIHNNDNIFKGKSSFAVEMEELLSILKRSNENSIVLGDELCSGTENTSALSIFTASVVELSKKNTNFIFATHLHKLCDLKWIKELNNIASYHLKVKFDEETNKLIYDRKLSKGNGYTIYGLEVCKSLGFDTSFINFANNIRRNILNIENSILPYNQSHFNSNIYVDKCEICKLNNIKKKGEEVHHIKFQSCADSNNMIGSQHKNVKSNLVVLCKECHNRVHNGNIEIYGYIQTSKGIELNYNIKNKKELKNRKKYTTQQVEYILKMCKDSKLSKKLLCHKIKEAYDINISTTTLNKIIKGIY